MNSALHAAALEYAQNGFPVFPVHSIRVVNGKRVCSCSEGERCTSPAKHPACRSWPAEAATDEAEIDRLWAANCWNIGLVTGALSGVVVLDIDPRHCGDEALSQFEAAHNALPATARFLTGGGGEHIVFKHFSFPVSNSVGQLGAGIDIRGDGGYIVAPPSEHISGRQ